MFNKIIAKSLFGWNRFSTGSHKQRLIAAILAGAIIGGTESALEIVTGLAKRKKEYEERMKAKEETYRQLEEDLLRGLRQDFYKSMQED